MVYFHFVLSIFYVSFGRIDSHSVLYDYVGSLHNYHEVSKHLSIGERITIESEFY